MGAWSWNLGIQYVRGGISGSVGGQGVGYMKIRMIYGIDLQEETKAKRNEEKQSN